MGPVELLSSVLSLASGVVVSEVVPVSVLVPKEAVPSDAPELLVVSEEVPQAIPHGLWHLASLGGVGEHPSGSGGSQPSA